MLFVSKDVLEGGVVSFAERATSSHDTSGACKELGLDGSVVAERHGRNFGKEVPNADDDVSGITASRLVEVEACFIEAGEAALDRRIRVDRPAVGRRFESFPIPEAEVALRIPAFLPLLGVRTWYEGLRSSWRSPR